VTRSVVLGVWAAVALSAVSCELAARLRVTVRGGRRLASVSDVFDRMTSRRWSVFAAFVGWMWLGWHLFAR
jgi:hypothetical protein